MANIDFDEWSGGATDEELLVMQKTANKRRWLYILIWLAAVVVGSVLISVAGVIVAFTGMYLIETIAYVVAIILMLAGCVFMGFGIFCGNTANFIKSRGRTSGNGFARFILLLLGGIIIPLIVISICSKGAMGQKICGLN